MFKFIDKHPFVAGFITGFFGVGVIGKNIRKFFRSRVTIIQLNLNDIPESKNPKMDGPEMQPCGDTKPKVEEN